LFEEAKLLKQESRTGLIDWHNFLEEIPENLPRKCLKDLRDFIAETVREMPIEDFHLKEWINLLELTRFRSLKKIISGKLEAMEVTEENKNQFLEIGRMARKAIKTASVRS